ncbi:DNA-directed RNA polymerase sigma-70 factor [Chondromyces crocatus]|uniref:DNA-directed RNA polymerase sigma-70 factor n=2 Tax=Chondromyces crocatus TaxID=52 RepID=A0A0K1ENG1_CHOCO|nr:DNA-directed RNA polymerase sigma-70 factor [Chondromyces crocatus]
MALVARLVAGDEACFTQLVERLHGPMQRLARTLVRDQAGAQEIVQETWTVVLDSLPRFEGRASLKTWIFRILTNRARTRATRDKRMVPVAWMEDGGADDESAVSPERFHWWGRWTSAPTSFPSASPEDHVLRKEMGTRLLVELDALPQGQRAVVTLRDVDGCSSEEVCEILGINETNQRVLLHRGRARLRAALEQYLRSE